MKIEDERLLIKVRLYGKDSFLDTDALIDTGASFTILPSRIAEFLNLELLKGKVQLTTASGIVEATKRRLYKLKIDKMEINNLPVVIHDLPISAPAKVLLGMNFLMKTKLVVNGKNKEFIVEDPQESKK